MEHGTCCQRNCMKETYKEQDPEGTWRPWGTLMCFFLFMTIHCQPDMSTEQICFHFISQLEDLKVLSKDNGSVVGRVCYRLRRAPLMITSMWRLNNCPGIQWGVIPMSVSSWSLGAKKEVRKAIPEWNHFFTLSIVFYYLYPVFLFETNSNGLALSA